MAGKKDKAVVAVISGLTDNQAAQITKDIMKSKQRNAPNGRGTVASGFMCRIVASEGHETDRRLRIWQRTDQLHIQERRKQGVSVIETFVRYADPVIMLKDTTSLTISLMGRHWQITSSLFAINITLMFITEK